MARALIVGCGCRGRLLGQALAADGWEVRGTSRSQPGLDAIAATGLEPALADPDQPGSVLELVGDVGVVVWALGSATGPQELIAAVNGPRLERVLERLVDTPVRGFVYEAAGSAPNEVLAAGVDAVSVAGERWRIPVAAVDASPEDAGPWVSEMAEAVRGVLVPR